MKRKISIPFTAALTLAVLALLSQTGTAQTGLVTNRINVQVFGGLSLPTGDFASTSSVEAGGAKTGFVVGGELGVNLVAGLAWWNTVAVSFNSLNDELVKDLAGVSSVSGDIGSWTTVWPMTGLRYTTWVAPGVTIYATGQVGILFGSTPEVSVNSGGFRYSSKSFSSSAFAYGFGAGVLIANRFTAGVPYMTGQPEYDVEYLASAPGFTSTTTGKIDQPTSIFQLTVGIMF
jgi:hypothetical protein